MATEGDGFEHIRELKFGAGLFSKRIRYCMKADNIGFRKLGALLGISYMVLYRIVTDKNEPRATELMRIKEWFKMREDRRKQKLKDYRNARDTAQRRREGIQSFKSHREELTRKLRSLAKARPEDHDA